MKVECRLEEQFTFIFKFVEIIKLNFVKLFGLIVKMSLSKLDVYIILYDLKPEIFLHV